jgi:molybdopterin synthase catalytic subunit
MVRIRFFASYRELIGREEVGLNVQESITLGELLEKLKREVPRVSKVLDTGSPIIAVNQEIATKDTLVESNSEVAIFPPVSGGKGELVRIQRGDFDVGEEIKKMRKTSTKIGGIVAFLGTVRELSRGKEVVKLIYEHYPGMAEKKLMKLREKALESFDIIDMRIIHRTGELGINENIVLIVAAAVHREDAFKACEWCIDELKKTVPIWKKEVSDDGEVWIEEHP